MLLNNIIKLKLKKNISGVTFFEKKISKKKHNNAHEI